jgi:hypothetical protein
MGPANGNSQRPTLVHQHSCTPGRDWSWARKSAWQTGRIEAHSSSSIHSDWTVTRRFRANKTRSAPSGWTLAPHFLFSSLGPLCAAQDRWVDARPLSGFTVWPTDSISSRSTALDPGDPCGSGLFPSCAATSTNRWLLMLCARLLPTRRRWWSWGATHWGESSYPIRFEIRAPLSTCYSD